MKWAIPLTVTSVVFLAYAAPAHAQRWDDDFDRVTNIDGIWYLNGNPDAPCRIIQTRPDGRALFINEHGSRARGMVRGNEVWIPDWSAGPWSDGLAGRVRGDRIVWPDDSYWSRFAR